MAGPFANPKRKNELTQLIRDQAAVKSAVESLTWSMKIRRCEARTFCAALNDYLYGEARLIQA